MTDLLLFIKNGSMKTPLFLILFGILFWNSEAQGSTLDGLRPPEKSPWNVVVSDPVAPGRYRLSGAAISSIEGETTESGKGGGAALPSFKTFPPLFIKMIEEELGQTSWQGLAVYGMKNRFVIILFPILSSKWGDGFAGVNESMWRVPAGRPYTSSERFLMGALWEGRLGPIG